MRCTPFWGWEELTTQMCYHLTNQTFVPIYYVPLERYLAPSCAKPSATTPSSAISPQAVQNPVPLHLMPFQVPSAAARRTSKHTRLDPRTPDDVAASCATLSCGGTRSAATHNTTREITVSLMYAILEKAVFLIKSPGLGRLPSW